MTSWDWDARLPSKAGKPAKKGEGRMRLYRALVVICALAVGSCATEAPQVAMPPPHDPNDYPNPYQSPSPFGSQQVPPQGREAALERVKWPAVLLMILAPLGIILFAVGLTLQAGATGAVKTVKMSAKLVSGRAPDDPASE